MPDDLLTLTSDWDDDYRESLASSTPPPPPQSPTTKEETSGASRPFAQILTSLNKTADIRFQPFQNDLLQHFMLKLGNWVLQFEPADRKFAFLLASRIIYITQKQFDSLQRHLFLSHIRRSIMNDIISSKKLGSLNFTAAEPHFESEMNKTLFVPNSDSSSINSFVHINIDYFKFHGRRGLLGPEVKHWTYPRLRLGEDSSLKSIIEAYENNVLRKDPTIQNKERLVILEDFSGSGSDLKETLDLISQVPLPFKKILIAPVMATEHALNALVSKCSSLNGHGSGKFEIVTALNIPNKYRCYHTPMAPPMTESPYLDQLPISNLSSELSRISEHYFETHFKHNTELKNNHMHGFGRLAMAFSFFSNTPDTSLPIIWMNSPDWSPLFRRASRII